MHKMVSERNVVKQEWGEGGKCLRIQPMFKLRLREEKDWSLRILCTWEAATWLGVRWS